MEYVIYGMVYLGSALMLYNIYCFIRFAINMSAGKHKKENRVLHIPIALLVLFLAGYLVIGILGNPDLVTAGILFGGSIFVFVMYRLLDRITKQILENEQLKGRLLATEESNRAKAEFLSGVSHEMRTPLNVILGLDTMALKDTSLTAETKDRIEKIGSSAKHLLGLINNVLDMNSIETGEFVVKNERFSISDTVEQINAMIGPICSEKGLSYESRCGGDVAGDYTGDEMRIKQVLINLLDNAVKFTDAPGGVTLSVDGAGDNGGDVVCFSVSDTGVGIDPDFLPRVFDSFTKEDASSTAGYAGSGIGLAVTKSIVGQLGGRISVKSEKGKGSEFTVILPLKRADDGGEAGEKELSLEGRRVLIAEDIPENAEIVMDLLELEGVESDHAENGRKAVEMFTSKPAGYYDAILMDLRMPVMDGLTATREIRSSDHPDAKSIPILALSANAFESDVKESLEAGMNAHLSKPADSDLLYSALRKWTAYKPAERSAEK